MLLAGRAAELVSASAEEVTGGAGGGHESDFARATKIAVDLEARYGFGLLGTVCLPDRIVDLALQDVTMLTLVKERLDRCLARARDIVVANDPCMTAIADALATQGYLDRDGVDALLARHPPRIPAPPVAPERSKEPAAQSVKPREGGLER
jgi:ATP-dependent Zn protease